MPLNGHFLLLLDAPLGGFSDLMTI